MAPVPTPVMSPVVQMPAPPAGHPPVAAPIPAEPRDWSPPQWGQRPPIVGAIGVTSIVIASLSGLVGLVFTGYGFVFYVAAIAMSSRATWAGSAGAPTLASPGGGVAHSGTPRGQRQAVITSLTRTHQLDDPQRVAQLDAMLATAGRDLGTDNVLESGTMPDSRYGERGADYFVTPRGRLELFSGQWLISPGPVKRTPSHWLKRDSRVHRVQPLAEAKLVDMAARSHWLSSRDVKFVIKPLALLCFFDGVPCRAVGLFILPRHVDADAWQHPGFSKPLRSSPERSSSGKLARQFRRVSDQRVLKKRIYP